MGSTPTFGTKPAAESFRGWFVVWVARSFLACESSREVNVPNKPRRACRGQATRQLRCHRRDFVRSKIRSGNRSHSYTRVSLQASRLTCVYPMIPQKRLPAFASPLQSKCPRLERGISPPLCLRQIFYHSHGHTPKWPGLLLGQAILTQPLIVLFPEGIFCNRESRKSFFLHQISVSTLENHHSVFVRKHQRQNCRRYRNSYSTNRAENV